MDTETIDYTEIEAVTETEAEIEAKAEAEKEELSDETERMALQSEENIETSLGNEKTVLEAEMSLSDASEDNTELKEGLSDGSEAGAEITDADPPLPADETSAVESLSSLEEVAPSQSLSGEVEMSPEVSSSVEEAASPKATLSLDGPGQGTGTGIQKILEDLDSSSSLEAFSEEPFFDGTEYTVSDLYFQMVVSNRLLGIIAALLVVFAIWALIKFFVRLVANNITNHF